jgi:hypothetical protein
VIIKVVLVLGAVAAAVWLLRGTRHAGRLAFTRLCSLAFALAWIVAVLFPDLVTAAANLVGVGRGTDLLIYALVLVVLFTGLGQYRRMRELEAQLAELTRALALANRQGGPDREPLRAHHG